MLAQLDQQLAKLRRAGSLGAMAGGLKGLEKESLRVVPDGELAPTPHPRVLGSPLRHPALTTDYSEALIEFVTPAFANTSETLGYLEALHRHVYRHIGTERLWAASMPCRVTTDADVPLAEFGSSNVGQMKKVYRRGLGYRYGRVMQCIAGVHFNYSLPERGVEVLGELYGAEHGRDLKDAVYLGLTRNFQRLSWIVPLLTGASPALCRSFVGALPGSPAEGLPMIGPGTLHAPHGTSLRMSPIGYRNPTQAGLEISYANLDAYALSLTHAIETAHAPYEAIGVKVDGEYRQLNANLLQIENEYYASMRPKQPTRTGEKPTLALRRRGVEYVEMRLLDLDPFAAVGVTAATMHVMECLLIACAIAPSAPYSSADRACEQRSIELVAMEGRAPGAKLDGAIGTGSPVELGRRLLASLAPVAEALDGSCDAGTVSYSAALAQSQASLDDPSQLPAARVIDSLSDGTGFFDFSLARSNAHREQLLSEPVDATLAASFEQMAQVSLEEQAELERTDDIDFDTYLARYFAQTLTTDEAAVA